MGQSSQSILGARWRGSMFSPVSPGHPSLFQVFTQIIWSHLRYLLLCHHPPCPQHTHTHTHTHTHGAERVVPKSEILRMLCVRVCVCSPPGSSVSAILQARILVWVAISVSRGVSFPTQGSDKHLLHLLH